MTIISTPTSVGPGGPGPSVVNTQGFRYFRVFKTGNNGTGNGNGTGTGNGNGTSYNLLHIAAIELYGVLIEAPAPGAPGAIQR